MLEYKHIKLTEEADGKVHVVGVRLAWPVAHALTQALLSELGQLMNYLEDERPNSLVIFYDLETQDQLVDTQTHMDHWHKWESFLRRLENYQGASIACINGLCSYFHLQLLLVCDYRIATEQASFQMPEISKGYLPGMALFRLAKYLGLGVARNLSFTGRRWSAQEALEKGLVDYQYPVAELDSALEKTKMNLSTQNLEVLHYARRLLNESFATPYEQAIGNFLAAQNLCLPD